MDRWICPLTIGAAAADIVQLYPAFAPASVDPATAVTGDQLRYPCEGQLVSLQVCSDGTNGGILEVYDISGTVLGANVSSASAITDAQLDAAIAAGKAKLILKQNFAGSGLTPWTSAGPVTIAKGLAARAVGQTGTCDLNLEVMGCYRYLTRGPAL